ncbi:MAG TPA: hypothetical protein VLO09_03495, partial [Ornithinimicrobium sp.]|nr:hypothetical protein [Ornithinimicrobium sp.]
MGLPGTAEARVLDGRLVVPALTAWAALVGLLPGPVWVLVATAAACGLGSLALVAAPHGRRHRGWARSLAMTLAAVSLVSL